MKKIIFSIAILFSTAILIACSPSLEDQRQSAIDDLTTLEEYIEILDNIAKSAELEPQVFDSKGLKFSTYAFAEGTPDYYDWGSSKPEERIFEDVDSLSSATKPDTIRLYYGVDGKDVPTLIYSKKQFDPGSQIYVTFVTTLHSSRYVWRALNEDTTSVGISKYSGITYAPSMFEQVNKSMFGGKYNYNAYRAYYRLLENFTGIKSYLQ